MWSSSLTGMSICKLYFAQKKLNRIKRSLLKKFGVLDLRRPLAPPIGTIRRFQSGTSTLADTKEQYGIRYNDTVNAMRDVARKYADFQMATVKNISRTNDGQSCEVGFKIAEKRFAEAWLCWLADIDRDCLIDCD